MRFVSKSKIPPELGAAAVEILDVRSDGVDALGFHGGRGKIKPESIPQGSLPKPV